MLQNDYEVEIGTFEGSINPTTQTFGQWAEFVDQRWGRGKKEKKGHVLHVKFVVKASAHLVQNGFEEVFHLRGGILNYLEKVAPSKANGRENALYSITGCQLFTDYSMAKTKLCFSCRWPLADEDFQSPSSKRGYHALDVPPNSPLQEKRAEKGSAKTMALACKRRTKHIGKEMPRQSPGLGPSCT